MSGGILDLIPTPSQGDDITAIIDGAPMAEQDKMRAAVKAGLMPDPQQMAMQMQQGQGAPAGGLMPGGPPPGPQMPPQAPPQGLASGGPVREGVPASGRYVVGLVKHPSPGRADAVDAVARVGSYVIPADVVSALGEGNTDAGAKVLEQGLRNRNLGFADGGLVPEDAMEVKLSGGEFVFPPEDVEEIGNGDMRAGASELDKFVSSVRERVSQMAPNMPEPK